MLCFFCSLLLIQGFPSPRLSCCFRMQMQSRVRNQIGEAPQVCTSAEILVSFWSSNRFVLIITTAPVKLCCLSEQSFFFYVQQRVTDLRMSLTRALSCSMCIFLHNDVMAKNASKLNLQPSSVMQTMILFPKLSLCLQ